MANVKLITKDNEKALEEFMITVGGIRRCLEVIENAADDHLGFSPDEINWGHVGTANHILDKLRAVLDVSLMEDYF